MAKKPGISFERHQEIGAELKEMSERLVKLMVEFGNAYPLSGREGKAHSYLSKARHAITDARAFAEETYFREHREKADLNTYYPGQDPGPYRPGQK